MYSAAALVFPSLRMGIHRASENIRLILPYIFE